ncbi:MAG: hypothetical protein E7315_05315 [Clostridiales bacterium]|nr:hypothetical protein [Clostridiales bacterium]
MKKIIAVFLIVISVLCASGCTVLQDYTAKGYDNVSIKCKSTWTNVTEGTPYDLQLTDKSSYFSIMAYRLIDLADGQTPRDIYAAHNEWIKESRDNCTTVENEVTRKSGDNIIVKTLFSAEKNSNKNYYDSYLITNEKSDTFLWVLITTLPSMYQNNVGEYTSMIESIVLE